MLSRFATENYLKALVKALSEPDRDRIRTGELAQLMGVTSGTATAMMDKLSKDGYLDYEPRRGCTLTDAGRAYGLRIIRRHRLLETFLFRVLGLDWYDIHEEAENLEHSASDKLIEVIDAYLGHPERDPHGDEIPGKDQQCYVLNDISLASLEEGSRVSIARIDGDGGVLSYYQREGLLPGAEIQILHKDTDAGLVVLAVAGRERTMALKALKGVFTKAGETS